MMGEEEIERIEAVSTQLLAKWKEIGVPEPIIESIEFMIHQRERVIKARESRGMDTDSRLRL